jgi:hypothetical protein
LTQLAIEKLLTQLLAPFSVLSELTNRAEEVRIVSDLKGQAVLLCHGA